MSTRKAIVMMVIASVMWSIAGVIFKYINCNSIVIAGARSAFSALTVLVYMLVCRKKFMVNKTTVMNALFLTAVFFSFVTANKLTSAANAIVLQYTAPVFILIYNVVFKRTKPHIHDIICVAVTFFGIALFFSDSIGNGNIFGDIVALASGVFFAAMMIAIGDSTEEESINGIFQGQLLTAILGLPMIAFTENTFDAKTIGLLAILGIVQLGIPYIIVALAGIHCPPLASTLVTAFEPLLNPIWVALIFGEIPGPIALCGGLIVLVNVVVWCVMRDKREAKG